MTDYKVPMLIDCFRLTERSELKTTVNIIDHVKRKAGGFNYNRSATFTRKAYHGYRNFDSLYSQCEGKNPSTARIHNTKVLKATAPLSAGRKIQTFDFPKRKFRLAPNIEAALGPQFFFTENGIVKLLYIHARNDYRASLKDFAGLAWALKNDVLDEDFFEQPSDIEFIDIDKRKNTTSVNVYSLEDLLSHRSEDPSKTLARFLKCFTKVREQSLAGEITKPKPRTKEEHPDLFA